MHTIYVDITLLNIQELFSKPIMLLALSMYVTLIQETHWLREHTES